MSDKEAADRENREDVLGMSAFWGGHRRDLRDPGYRRAFVAEAKRVALVDEARNEERAIRDRSRPHPITHRYRPRYVAADLRAADLLRYLADEVQASHAERDKLMGMFNQAQSVAVELTRRLSAVREVVETAGSYANGYQMAREIRSALDKEPS